MAAEDLAGLKIDKTAAFSRPPRRKRLRLWLLVAGVAAVAAWLAARGVFTPAVGVETATVSQVYPSQSFTLLNASGYVVAQRKAAVASKATGRLEWLGVEEGSRVKAGEVLARLENRDTQATRDQAAAGVNTARASLDQAKAELSDATLAFNRQKELFAGGIVARADYDVADARYRRAVAGVAGAEAGVWAAQAAYRAADVAVEYTLIRAPFDAVVLTKDADVGDIVTPLGAAANAKAAVVTIADLGSLQVQADVSESNLQKVRMGEPCEIQLDALPDTRFRGVVHMIVPTADRSKATVLVKVRFVDKDRRVLPEMSARVAFLERPVAPAEERPFTAVSQAAVATRDGRTVVFLLKGERVAAVPVVLGARMGDMVEVKSGVRAGEKIAVNPLEKLKDGMKIKAAEQ
jgi:RND family efflux transporter MFP subunit